MNVVETLRQVVADSYALIGQTHICHWRRTAIRTDENPALNVAIHFANRLGLPLLVYQGLSERYPFASDRHHTFILHDARDVQLAFADKNITCLFHVERPGNRGPHLRTLVQRAAVLVSEDIKSSSRGNRSFHLEVSVTIEDVAI